MAFRSRSFVKPPGVGRALVIVLLLFMSIFSAFPQPWNSAMGAMREKVGFSLPKFSETPFRLGLDLQGGVHLVYEADMQNIPESDRTDALLGVKDVIERRANALGVSEARVETTTADGRYRVIVELPGLASATEAMASIGETPVLEFKTPTREVSPEPTAEEQAAIEAAQTTEREAALDVLDRALTGEDFALIAKEFSIDGATKDTGGVIGFVYTDDPLYGPLVKDFSSRKRPGVIDGLYEIDSQMHIMKLLSTSAQEEVEASHILVCYAGATGCAGSFTKDEARAKIEEIRLEATPENFADLAAEHSTEPGAAETKGSLGTVRQGMMVQSFEDALFALEDGALSDVVETNYGFHIIYRESSSSVTAFELAHIEMPWTTVSDIVSLDPWENTELSGEHIRRASVAFDASSGAPYVLLEFNSEGAQLFTTLTEENVGEVIGIFLDGEPVTTPVVNEVIYGGQAQITGGFTLQEAKVLAQRLNAGALPVPIVALSQKTVGPTLGAASLAASIRAAVVGFALVSLFVVFYYRLPGLLAVFALMLYASLNLALYKWLGVTLTLSGIAGFVLSLGIAVDANVLLFERLKEELRSGRDLPSAIHEAAERAWPSIRDGNATTLIATFILYNSVHASFVQGFAVTLALGICIAVFSAMVVTRWLLGLVARFPVVRRRLFFLGFPKV